MNEKKELLEIYDEDNNNLSLPNYCEKAKNIFIGYYLQKFYKDYPYSLDIENNSPIEQIFEVAYRLYMIDFYFWNKNIEDIEKLTRFPFFVIFNDELSYQKEIIYNGKKYIADFLIDFSVKCKNSDEYLYPEFHDLKYIIELDGHEYHSDKKQVNYDYERERDLQELGYKVIPFTGSQIFNNPFTCIDKLVQIILNDMMRKI